MDAGHAAHHLRQILDPLLLDLDPADRGDVDRRILHGGITAGGGDHQFVELGRLGGGEARQGAELHGADRGEQDGAARLIARLHFYTPKIRF